MLKYLLKYDLKNVFKVLIIFYALAIFFAGLTRLFFSIENSFFWNIIGQICGGVTISMIFNIVINNLMRLWARFKQNFYGDESYLTHTLPVTKGTLYASKTVTALFTLLLSVAVSALALCIAYYSKENLAALKAFLLPVADAFDSSIVWMLLMVLLVLFLELLNALQCGFIGIILGHRMNSGKSGFSVLWGFLIYIGSQALVVIPIGVLAIFRQDFMNLFFTNTAVELSTVKAIIYLATAVYALLAAVGYFVGRKLFQKGVNVD